MRTIGTLSHDAESEPCKCIIYAPNYLLNRSTKYTYFALFEVPPS